MIAVSRNNRINHKPRVEIIRGQKLRASLVADNAATDDGERPSILDASRLTYQEALRLNAVEHYLECKDYEQELFSGVRTLPAASFGEEDVERLGGGSNVAACKTAAPLFSEAECRAVIEEAEHVAASREEGWTTKRHNNYATTDIPIVDLPRSKAWFLDQLQVKVLPFLAQCFPRACESPDDFRIFDVFVVKYNASGGQSLLQNHRDGSLISINIALNPSESFVGGGTWIASLGRAVRIEAGGMLAHSSSLLHGGAQITAGVRYILVGFLLSTTEVEDSRRLLERAARMRQEGMLGEGRAAIGMLGEGGRAWGDEEYDKNAGPLSRLVSGFEATLSTLEQVYGGRVHLLRSVLILNGWLLARRGGWKDAENELRRASMVGGEGEKFREGGRNVLRMLAWVLLESGQEEQAVATLSRADEDMADLCRRGEAGTVRESLRRWADEWGQGEGRAAVRDGLERETAAIEGNDGREDEARRMGQPGWLLVKTAKALCQLGAALAEDGDLVSAERTFAGAVVLDGSDSMAQLALQFVRDDLARQRN